MDYAHTTDLESSIFQKIFAVTILTGDIINSLGA